MKQQTEQRHSTYLRKNRFAPLILFIIGLVNGIFCLRHARDFFEQVDISLVDPNTILLVKTLSWQAFGGFSILMGFVFLSFGQGKSFRDSKHNQVRKSNQTKRKTEPIGAP